MSKPLEKGSYVLHERHPEHGLGRVVSVGTFAIRVLFLNGGVRVFRAGQPHPLRGVTPQAIDVESLAAKEDLLAQGKMDAPVGSPKPPAKKQKKKQGTS